jgi:hypothetical protein
MRAHDRSRPSRLAALGGKVALTMFLLSLTAAPSSAAAREPAPDPSPGAATGTARSGNPAPEAEPQSPAQSTASHAAANHPPPSTYSAPSTQAPSYTTTTGSSPTGPATAAPSQSAGSEAPQPSGAASASSPAPARPTSNTASAAADPQRSPTPQAGAVAVHTGTPGTARRSQQPLLSRHPAAPDGVKAAHAHDPTSTFETGAATTATNHRHGLLMLLGSLALGLLVLASLALLRRLTRLAGVWYEEPQL